MKYGNLFIIRTAIDQIQYCNSFHPLTNSAYDFYKSVSLSVHQFSSAACSSNEEFDPERRFSSSSLNPSDLLLTAESLGLHSSLDCSHGSNSNRNSGGGRQSRRNSSESSSSLGSTRWKRRTIKSTSLRPFKLRTEQRGRSKQEEFMKKVYEMLVEQQKQRIPIAQGLPFTTDEPECLVKPPVKESTRPIDVVLHSDVRAVERAEFDNHVQEKLSLIEEYKLERERMQKMEEEESHVATQKS